MKAFNKLMIDKGEYGYIDARKKRFLILSILFFLAVFIIFITGIIIYHTNKSLFAVIAAVSSLPAAKILTGYITIYPYSSGDKALYLKLNDMVKKYNSCLACDLAITSEKKASFIQYAYSHSGKLFLFTSNPKIDIDYAGGYIKKILDQNCNYSLVKIYTDKDKFIKIIDEQNDNSTCEAMDQRIIHKLLSYSI